MFLNSYVVIMENLNMETIKVVLHSDILPPEKMTVGDWIDLRAGETVIIDEGEQKNISLGISMQLPEGYEAILAPRSSTFSNWGIIMVGSIGVIDNSYCGTNDIWSFPAYCVKGKEEVLLGTVRRRLSVINKGDRICQFRIQKVQPVITFEVVDRLENTDRGGLGSTGVV